MSRWSLMGAVLGLLTLAPSCGAPTAAAGSDREHYLQVRTSGWIGCLPNDVVISDYEYQLAYGAQRWTATCGPRVLVCSTHVETMHCTTLRGPGASEPTVTTP